MTALPVVGYRASVTRPRPILVRLFLRALVLLAALPASVAAQAPRRHVVDRGETLSTIAERYRVTVAALASRNHLSPPYSLRHGQVLSLPASAVMPAQPAQPARPAPGRSAATAPARRAAPVPATTGPTVPRPARATPAPARASSRRRGQPAPRRIVHLVREYNGEEATVDLTRVTPAAVREISRILRFPDGRQRAIDRRLIRQIGLVSAHFGARTLHVISGYRPRRPHQYTRHSKHNLGHAIDFRVEGVSNRTLRDYCRTLPQTGCGYYPRSVFVHMDVRAVSTYWVDWSRPGEAPRYGREDRPPSDTPPGRRRAVAHAQPDESVEDVAQSEERVRSAPPPPEEPGEDAAPSPSSGSPSVAPSSGADNQDPAAAPR